MFSNLARRLRLKSQFKCKSPISAVPNIDPVQEKLLEEECILVDSEDRQIGAASKRVCHLLNAEGISPLHRAFSLFMFNERDELLLQQRSDTKITFPGLWTNTCCSHPLASITDELETKNGLGARVAARRRAFNELNIDLNQLPLEKILYLTRILYSAPSAGGKWGENELDYILFFRGYFDFKPVPDEVKNTVFVKRNDLKEFIEEQQRDVGITPWFKFIAGNLLPKWWENLHCIEKHVDHNTIHNF